jgi:DNA polymerase-1
VASQSTKPLVLLDADLIVYRALSNTEHEVCWDEEYEVYVLSTDLKRAKADYLSTLDRLLDQHGPHQLVVAISDRQSNFRNTLLPTYKGHRDGKRKPMGFWPFLEWASDLESYAAYNYGGVVVRPIVFPTLEADDVLGILASKPGNANHLVVSDDKDLMTVPCTLLRNGEVMTITEDEANLNHLRQTLTGDQTDGYQGCPGIGPVKAERIVKQGWNGIVAAYQKEGLTEADALVQARVARILRWSDWDTQKKEPILWEPSRMS